MKHNESTRLSGLLILPLLISACGGSGNAESLVNSTAQAADSQTQATVTQTSPQPESTEQTGKDVSQSATNQSHAVATTSISSIENVSSGGATPASSASDDSQTQATVTQTSPQPESTLQTGKDVSQSATNQSHAVATTSISSTENVSSGGATAASSASEHGEQSDTALPPAKDDLLAKTVVTDELREQVKEAKTARDNAGLPAGYAAVYTIESADGKTQELQLAAAEGSADNYFFNSTIFPMGEAQGKVVTTLDGEPHTEETFKSYQQFYVGIDGTQKQVVYFDDGPNQRDEPFSVELPIGLLTEQSGIPTGKEAIYNGKAISAAGFGDFTYLINFDDKVGKGGSIKWHQQGILGDIELAGGTIGEQVLSVYAHPELLPETHSHRGQGITGKASVAGSSEAYEYTALFFGPKAEEISGLVAKKHDDHGAGGLLSGHDDDKQNIASFAGER